MNDLPEKIDISWVYLGQEGKTILCQKIVELFFAPTFFLKLTHIYRHVLGLIDVHMFF